MKILVAIGICLLSALLITIVTFILGKPKISGSLYVVNDDDERYLFLELSRENVNLNHGDLVTFKVHNVTHK